MSFAFPEANRWPLVWPPSDSSSPPSRSCCRVSLQARNPPRRFSSSKWLDCPCCSSPSVRLSTCWAAAEEARHETDYRFCVRVVVLRERGGGRGGHDARRLLPHRQREGRAL